MLRPDDDAPRRRPRSFRDESASNRSDPPGTKVLFFGDSFVRLFGLVDHPDVRVHAFKGSTAKGLTRLGNDNRRRIVRAIRGSSASAGDRAVFVFGNVDVHLSFYHGKYGKDAPVDLGSIARDYVDFVASLPLPPGAARTVLGAYPSPLSDGAVPASLVSYGSLTEEQASRIDAADASLGARRGRVISFNRALSERCSLRGVGYEDVVDEMTDPATGGVRDAYRDVSDHNIHPVWETTVMLWMERWPWYGALAPAGFEDGLQRTLAEYLRTKPWAERTHVAEEVGVAAAVEGEQRAVQPGMDGRKEAMPRQRSEKCGSGGTVNQHVSRRSSRRNWRRGHAGDQHFACRR